MCKVRDMIDALAADDFDGARVALKASLADYMSGRAYVSNSDLFGKDYKDDYANPNVEDELKMVADLNGGEIRKHDKTGAREEVEEENEYERQLAMKKKKLRNNHYDDLEESKKTKFNPNDYDDDDVVEAYIASILWKEAKNSKVQKIIDDVVRSSIRDEGQDNNELASQIYNELSREDKSFIRKQAQQA